MKTGDDTFDDIYVSKDTGKVVGVIYEDVDYKLVPIKQEDEKMMKEPDHNADKFQYFSGRNKK
mgnify:CR=1 FL=1